MRIMITAYHRAIMCDDRRDKLLKLLALDVHIHRGEESSRDPKSPIRRTLANPSPIANLIV
jgi:hypothetical protein